MDANILYIIEYSYAGEGRLFKVTLPLAPVAIKENERTAIGPIYLNHTSGLFTITHIEKPDETNICVYDLLGNCVFKKGTGNEIIWTNYGSDGLTVNLSNQPKGIYFVQIVAGGKKITQKFVVE